MSNNRRTSLFLSLFVIAVGCSPGESREQPSGSAAVYMEKAVLPDPARNQMPAMEVLVPKGWELEGSVQAVAPAYSMIPYLADITVKAPDKRAVRFYGLNEFGYADGVHLQPFTPYQGRPFMPLFPSLGDWWQFVVRVAPHPDYSDVRIIGEERLPELSKLVQQQLAPLYQSTRQENMQLAMAGERKTFDVHARKLVLQYKDRGVPVEATVFATVRHAIYYRANGLIRAAMWNLDNMYAVAGPVGSDYLNDPVLAAIVRSKRNLPEWDAAIQQWYLMKNRQIVREGQARIAAAARQAAASHTAKSDDILDMSFNSWKRRNDMNRSGHSASINAIHGQTTFANPSGGTVNLPSYYQNVYTDQLGNYVLHNDANYQINTDPAFNGREWTRVEPVR